MPQHIYLIIGGPQDGKAYHPRTGRIDGNWINLNPSPYEMNGDFIYDVVRGLSPAEPLMVPCWVLVHRTIPRQELLWRVFMSPMRAFAKEVLGD